MKKCATCHKVIIRRNKCGDEEWSKKRFCSRPCLHQSWRESGQYRGNKNVQWKGGTISLNGYRYIVYHGKRILLHRHLMEQKLGRKLKTKEIVHHINHDKLDNRLSNLQLV